MFWEISVFLKKKISKYKQNPWKIQDNDYIIGNAGGFQSVISINNESPLTCFSSNLPIAHTYNTT